MEYLDAGKKFGEKSDCFKFALRNEDLAFFEGDALLHLHLVLSSLRLQLLKPTSFLAFLATFFTTTDFLHALAFTISLFVLNPPPAQTHHSYN